MLQIRKNVFETNSSSTHSLIFANEDEWDKLTRGELYINRYSCDFVTKEDAIRYLVVEQERYGVSEFNEVYVDYIDCYTEHRFENDKPIDFNSLPADELECYLRYITDIVGLDSYLEDEMLESYHREYVTKSGETVHAFGVYGSSY